jgi:hypothetical protein
MRTLAVTFWLLLCKSVVFVSTLTLSSVALAELDSSQEGATSQTLLAADRMLISPSEKIFTVDVDLSYDSNLLSRTDPNYGAESFVSLSSRYEISPRLSLGEQIGVMQKFDNSHHTGLSNMKVQLTYQASAKDSPVDIKYNMFGYLPTNADDRAQTSYDGGVGIGIDIAKHFNLPGLHKAGLVSYGFSVLKNMYEDTLDYQLRPNMSYRLRHSINYNQQLTKYFSVQFSTFYQNNYEFDNSQHSFFQLSELINYQSSKNVSFYIGHTNEADALEDDGIDTNFNLYDVNESYFVSGAKISF